MPRCDPDDLPQPDSKLHKAVHHPVPDALHQLAPCGLPLAEGGSLPQSDHNLPQADPDPDNVPRVVHHAAPDALCHSAADSLWVAGYDALHHNLPQPGPNLLARV